MSTYNYLFAVWRVCFCRRLKCRGGLFVALLAVCRVAFGIAYFEAERGFLRGDGCVCSRPALLERRQRAFRMKRVRCAFGCRKVFA